MNAEVIIFFILALMAISCAVLVINSERMSHMILAMVFTFLAIAGLYFLLRAEFIGVVQIIVYVGAMAILFVFGVMLTEHKIVTFDTQPHRWHSIVSFLGVAILLMTMLYGISVIEIPGAESPQYIGSAFEIGMELYGSYVVAFEAVGVLLLVALVGAVVLARKETE